MSTIKNKNELKQQKKLIFVSTFWIVAIEKVDTWGRKNIVRLDMWEKSSNFAPEFKQYGYVYQKGNYLWVNI